MIDVAITKMSSKGQIVIPFDMREGFEEGEKIVIISTGEQMILKKAKDLSKNLKEDLEFAKRTEKAWKRYDKGEFTSSSVKDFLKKLKKGNKKSSKNR